MHYLTIAQTAHEAETLRVLISELTILSIQMPDAAQDKISKQIEQAKEALKKTDERIRYLTR